MAETLESRYRPMLEAISFAGRVHRSQLRKDEKTPYVAHVFRVCLIARHIFGIDDPQVLTAAALHDTIEDTNTDFDDLEKQFGTDIAGWVALLSKDKRFRDEEREVAYEKQLAAAPWQVKICKLADIFDNLMDSHHSPALRQRAIGRSRRYLAALQTDLPAQAKGPFQIVSQLLAEFEKKP